MLEAGGAIAVALPLHRIEACGDTELQREQLARSRAFDGWIFTSANAVRRCSALTPPNPWPTLYAVGVATARALQECGHPGAQVAPEGSTSEALLDLPSLRQVGGQRLLVCTGAGGRDVLATTLAARGAVVESIALYRRVPIEYSTEDVTAAIDTADAVIVTSGEGLQRLHELTPLESRPHLLALPLVVPSARVLEMAGRLGFTAAVAPAEMSDAALLHSLERALAAATQAQ